MFGIGLILGLGLGLVGIVLAIIITISIYQPRLKAKVEIDSSLYAQERQLKEEIAKQYKKVESLNQDAFELNDEIDLLTKKANELKIDIAASVSKKDTLLQSIQDIEAQAKTTTEAIYEKNMTQMSVNFEQSAEKMSKEFQQAEEDYKDEYLSMMEDLSASLLIEMTEKKEQLAAARLMLDELAEKIAAAVAASKRALEIAEEADFYRINISPQDVAEIQKLKEIIPFLRDQEALNKVIWKVYYEKPTSDMIGRVIGQDKKTGIYKITDISNQKCYVGQAVSISERWRQHIKRGLGAETPTRNKLYPVMMEKGVENFTFELIEECAPSLLDEREDFWQDFFHAKDFGYSIK